MSHSLRQPRVWSRGCRRSAPSFESSCSGAGIFLHDDLHDSAVQRVRAVDRRRAAFDIVDEAAFVGDDQRPLKLPHVFRVDPEVRLQRNFTLYAFRHVDEAAAGPYRAVQRRKFVVCRRNDRSEILFERVPDIPSAAESVSHEDDALLFQVFLHVMVNDFGFVLRGYAGQELLLRFRNAQLVESFLDFFRHFLPRFALLFGRLHVVRDVVEIEIVQVAAPIRHRHAVENVQGFQAEFQHPFRLVLDPGNFLDDLARQTFSVRKIETSLSRNPY